MVMTTKSIPMTAPIPTSIPPSSACTIPPPLSAGGLPVVAGQPGSWIPAPTCLIGSMGNLLYGKDSRWLQLDVCREFVRSKCCRSDQECRYAHPPPNVEVQNGRVMCCFDSIKGKCQRKDPPCKYLHPPQHLKEQLLQNGRNNLILKHINMQLLAYGFLPTYPSLVYDMSGSLASYSSTPTTTPLTSDMYSGAGGQYVLTSPSSYYTSYPMMPLLAAQQPQQLMQQPEQLPQLPTAVPAPQRCLAGSVGSSTGSELGSTGSSDHILECNSPDGLSQQVTPGCSTLCPAEVPAASNDDLAKLNMVAAGRSVPWPMGGVESCPAPAVNLIPCPPYYSPVYLSNTVSYAAPQPGLIPANGLKRPSLEGAADVSEGKCGFENPAAPQIEGADRLGCNGYVMYPVTAPGFAPPSVYATMTAPTQHLAYVPYQAVNGPQYSLPPQFTSSPAGVMARY